jgi:hypothetical protein
MKANNRYIVTSLLLSCVFISRALAVPGDVISFFPAPCHTATGMAFDGQHLWMADRATDSLFAVDPVTGNVVQTLPAPGFDISALAWDGHALWCADRDDGRLLQFDVKAGITLRSIEAPSSSPQGLAWDGHDLWMVDDTQSLLSRISTDDGTTIATYPAPSSGSSGLTWWKGYLWCADRRDDRIYLFDPAHGDVVFGMDAPGKYARGLATDGTVLWNADYQADQIFKLSLSDSQFVKRSGPHVLDLALTYEFRNFGPGTIPSLDVYIAIPGELPNQKLLSEARFTRTPTDVLRDQWQQLVAHFHFTNVQPEENPRITMRTTAELADSRWFIYPDHVGKLSDIPRATSAAYLTDLDKYRIHDPIIQNAVREAVGDETNPYWMMRKIHKYVCKKLHYELAGGWNVAPQVLTRGSGSCSEYTFLFIAMCRAAGLPARYVGSVVVRGDEASADDVFHRWSQVYMPGYGWMHVDPQGGDRDKPAEVASFIGSVSNRFLITTEGGGASDYLGWNYNYDQTWTAKGAVKVSTKAVGEWSPSTVKADSSAPKIGGGKSVCE